MTPDALSYLAETHEQRAPGLAAVLREWGICLEHNDVRSVARESLTALVDAERLARKVPSDAEHRTSVDVLTWVFLEAARAVFERDAAGSRAVRKELEEKSFTAVLTLLAQAYAVLSALRAALNKATVGIDFAQCSVELEHAVREHTRQQTVVRELLTAAIQKAPLPRYKKHMLIERDYLLVSFDWLALQRNARGYERLAKYLEAPGDYEEANDEVGLEADGAEWMYVLLAEAEMPRVEG